MNLLFSSEYQQLQTLKFGSGFALDIALTVIPSTNSEYMYKYIYTKKYKLTIE